MKHSFVMETSNLMTYNGNTDKTTAEMQIDDTFLTGGGTSWTKQKTAQKKSGGSLEVGLIRDYVRN